MRAQLNGEIEKRDPDYIKRSMAKRRLLDVPKVLSNGHGCISCFWRRNISTGEATEMG